jgi:hypothetical protein
MDTTTVAPGFDAAEVGDVVLVGRRDDPYRQRGTVVRKEADLTYTRYLIDWGSQVVPPTWYAHEWIQVAP